MSELVLSSREQQALRCLMAAEPCPGSPLPSTQVLEQLDVLVPSDDIGAVYQDGDHRLTMWTTLVPWDDPPDPDESHGGPFYLGVMHWGHNPRAAEACGTLDGIVDGVVVGFRNGADSIVQVVFDRCRREYTDRDLAVLRLVSPLLGRLVRERPTPSLPVSLTLQERRVLSHVAAGESNERIAEALFVAPSTVRKHLEHAYRKLGVSSRVAAVARLQGRDLPDLDLRERLARLG